jgi:hypothetical protein
LPRQQYPQAVEAVSENFPFETVEQFLKATEKKVKRMGASVNTLAPQMPDTTPAGKIGIGAAILGVVAFTQSDDVRVQLATIGASTVIVVAHIICDAWLRVKRNERVGYENATSIEAAANIHIADSEE